MFIDASCVTAEWPLTVDEGTLVCHDGSAVTFTGGGAVYAVNGMATTVGLGIEIEPIWKENPAIAGTRINIGQLIDLGLSLCKE